MSIAVTKVECPACGADIDSSSTYTFCPYCGKRLLIDDGSKTINKKIDINSRHERIIRHEHITRDESKSKLSAEQETELIVLSLGILVLLFGFMFFGNLIDKLTPKEESHENEIEMCSSAKSYIGKDYSIVVEEFSNMGFDNVQTRAEKPPLFKKDGTISRITVAGNSDFSKYDWFPKDSTVVITYYSKDS